MIHPLPREVVDRIAAGEVVERPASVIKELMENALDAGATRITVEVEGGGIGLVRVTDDGRGMLTEDLPLAFAAHATSKLTDVDDLMHIVSYGFRGEALSSIGAVSRSRILSRTAEAPGGFRVDCHAGVSTEVHPVGCAPGTVVEVRDLFFNTPVRRRFLGAARTEAARCREVVASVALAQPGVRFTYSSDGSTRIQVGADAGLPDRVSAVYGRDFVDEMIPLEAATEGAAVEGLLTLPGAARSRPRAQLVFVNGRLIRDRGVQAAVRAGCKDFLPGALQPSYVLLLTLDPERVDVNVHPTKAEVRFADRDAVFRLVRRATRDALLGADLAPRVPAAMVSPRQPPAPAPTSVLPFGVAMPGSQPARPVPGVPLPSPAPAPDLDPGPVARPSPPAVPAAPRAARRFLQVLDTYLVHDGGDGLVIVDQHALHERVLYSRLQRQRSDGRIESQRLLVPETVRLEPSDYDRALAMTEELTGLGITLEAFGPDTVAVHAVPAVLRHERVADLIRDLLTPPELHGGIPDGLDRRLFTMACHAAIKAGAPLREEEITELLTAGEELEHDATCPHGRPTRVVIDDKQLETLFKRSGF